MVVSVIKILVRTRTERQYDCPVPTQCADCIPHPSSYSGRGEGGPTIRPPSPDHGSAFEHKVVNPVLLPALFIVLCAKRFLLTEADSFDSIRRDPTLHKGLLDGIGTARSQSKVVFLRSPVVTMPFDNHLQTGVLREEGAVILRSGHFVRAQGGLVVVKEYILHVLAE